MYIHIYILYWNFGPNDFSVHSVQWPDGRGDLGAAVLLIVA